MNIAIGGLCICGFTLILTWISSIYVEYLLIKGEMLSVDAEYELLCEEMS